MKEGIPCEDDLEKISNQINSTDCERWIKLGRRLLIEQPKLTEIGFGHQSLSEKSYQMLLHWKQKFGSGASYRKLYAALCHENVARQDLADSICCRA